MIIPLDEFARKVGRSTKEIRDHWTRNIQLLGRPLKTYMRRLGKDVRHPFVQCADDKVADEYLRAKARHEAAFSDPESLTDISVRLKKPLMTVRGWVRNGLFDAHYFPLGKRGQLVLCCSTDAVEKYLEVGAQQKDLRKVRATLRELSDGTERKLGTINTWRYKNWIPPLKKTFPVVQRDLVGPRGLTLDSVPRSLIKEINDADAVRAHDKTDSPEAAPKWVPEEHPGWTLVEDAAGELGLSVVTVKAMTVKRRRKSAKKDARKGAKVAALGNKPLTSKCFPALDKGGSLRMRQHVSRSELERLKSWEPPRPPEQIELEIDGAKVTHYRLEKSAELCDMNVDAFQKLYLHGRDFLGGKKWEPYRSLEYMWRRRQVPYFPLPKLQEIRKAREEARKAGWCGYGGLPVRIAADPTPTEKKTGGRPNKWDKLINFADVYEKTNSNPTPQKICNAYRKENSIWAGQNPGEPTPAILRDARKYRRQQNAKNGKPTVGNGRKTPLGKTPS